MINETKITAFIIILLGLVLVAGLYIGFRFDRRSDACEARGGEFVRTQQGWTCLRIKELKV